MELARLLGCSLALSLLSSPARAESFVEPSTEVPFETVRSVGGRPYLLLGAGVRKTLFIKMYAMALYVSEEGARRAFPALASKAGGRTRDKLLSGDRAQSFVVWGDFGKLGVLHFVRDESAERIRNGFESSLEPLLADKAPPELRDRARAFIALFDRDVPAGGEIVLETSPAGKVDVTIAGIHKEAATDLRLARGIWEAWLGPRAVSSDLKKDLVDRIELLGK